MSEIPKILNKLNVILRKRVDEFKKLMALSNEGYSYSEKQKKEYDKIPEIKEGKEKEWAGEFLKHYVNYLDLIFKGTEVDYYYEWWEIKFDKEDNEEEFFNGLGELKEKLENIKDEKAEKIIELIDTLIEVRSGNEVYPGSKTIGEEGFTYNESYERLRKERKLLGKNINIYLYALKKYEKQLGLRKVTDEELTSEYKEYKDDYKTINEMIKILKVLFKEYNRYYEISNGCDKLYYMLFARMLGLRDVQRNLISLNLSSLKDLQNIVLWLEEFKKVYSEYWDASMKQQIALMKCALIAIFFEKREKKLFDAVKDLYMDETEEALKVIAEKRAKNDKNYAEFEARWPTGPE